MTSAARPIGALLREWRQRRHLSQLDLALSADVSTRHLSFVETGRSQPSREMLLNLAERLEVPLRERNVLLTAAGFAPMFGERSLDDPALAPARSAVDRVLAAHEPYPAIAVDRRWTIVAANAAAGRILAGVDPALLRPPVNALRVALHRDGLAPRIRNHAEWRGHLLARLRRQIEVSGDAALAELLRELSEYPFPAGSSSSPRAAAGDTRHGGVVVPMQLDSPVGVLSLFTTIAVFGTPIDVTLSELALEAFLPADADTAERLRALAAAAPET